MCRLNIYGFSYKINIMNFETTFSKFLWLERMLDDRVEVSMVFASMRNIFVENQNL